MNVRDWPKGKSMPTIHGPFSFKMSSKPLIRNSSRSRADAERTPSSSVQRKQVMCLLPTGALVKSIPKTFMRNSSFFLHFDPTGSAEHCAEWHDMIGGEPFGKWSGIADQSSVAL